MDASSRPWLEGGKPVQLKAGDYAIKQNASMRQVIELLSEGKTVTYKVTIPEGLTSQQIVERLKADANLTGEIDGRAAGGLAAARDLHRRARHAARQAIVDRMQAEAAQGRSRRLWAQRKKDLPFKSLEEAIVLASIVEKETGRGDERERVAAVFVNRLQPEHAPAVGSHHSLRASAAARPCGAGRSRGARSRQKTSHNTYQIDGLPPTPICNPGRAAIEAVLNPADTKDLYFVADGTGGHVFSETLKDHNASVQKWRAVEKDIKGKARGAPPPTRRPRPRRAAAAAEDPRRRAHRAAGQAPPEQGAGKPPPPTPSRSAERERRSRPSLRLPCPCMALRLQSVGRVRLPSSSAAMPTRLCASGPAACLKR